MTALGADARGSVQRHARVDRQRLARDPVGDPSVDPQPLQRQQRDERDRQERRPLRRPQYRPAAPHPCAWTDLNGTSLPATDAAEHERRDAGVAVGVDRVGPDHRVAVLQREEVLDHGPAIVRRVPGLAQHREHAPTSPRSRRSPGARAYGDRRSRMAARTGSWRSRGMSLGHEARRRHVHVAHRRRQPGGKRRCWRARRARTASCSGCWTRSS